MTHNATHLRGAPLRAWREAKKTMDREADDKGYRTTLGCVGEPITNVLGKIINRFDVHGASIDELNLACLMARENLVHLINQHREAAADIVAEVIQGNLDTLDSTYVHEELNADHSLTDAADVAFCYAAQVADNLPYHVDVNIDDEEAL